jgi:hypothetical protein
MIVMYNPSIDPFFSITVSVKLNVGERQLGSLSGGTA